ncbi:hypothetical protein BGX28_000740 [Mortierella sp. GBA30]|nr:hypothetical protein BGX28_000740 [Mortierella sp. GBA30]
MVFSNFFSSSRGTLSPQKALDLAKAYLEIARNTDDPELILALCEDIDATLSRMKRTKRKALLAHPMNVEDQAVCKGISALYVDQGELLSTLGHRGKAQASLNKAEKWRRAQDVDCKPGLPVTPVTSHQPFPHAKDRSHRNDVAHVPSGIFSQNVAKPEAKHDLPKPGARITDTPQLAYCLALLSKTTSLQSPSAADPDEPLDEVQRAWIEAKAKDTDEQDRLHSLGSRLIAAFISDNFNDPATVAEVVYLAPVLDQSLFRRLLGDIIRNIEQSTLLEFTLLEGLVQVVQNAGPGCLLADDLVKILETLSTRLQGIHGQSTKHPHQLSLAVSRVLDAMADCEVKGLNREQLHAPLSAYLDGLKSSSDPYLVYQAAYAYQALQYVPDDETPLQGVLRRTRVVVKGASGLVSAVKSLDLNGFIDGLSSLQEGFEEVYHVAINGYEVVNSLIESGKGLLDSLKEGLSFSQKRAWYPALRGIDALLRYGRVAEFKKLVCEASCRRDPAFQCGLSQRLGEIAVNPLWQANTRRSAVDFLVELYKNDVQWGRHASVKHWILNILIQLTNMSESIVREHAHASLQDLSKNGDSEKQALYHACINGPPNQHPLKVCISPLASPSLLDLVQDIQDVEDDLRKLRERRLEARRNAVYIPPQAKSSLRAPDSTLFPLMEKVKEFLSSERQVLLLLGDSGAGKSTFNFVLECELWERYIKKEGRIPLHINLPALDRPEQDLIAKQLRRNDFTEPQIREMKHHRQFILICDGYDESQQIHNLYTSNQLNEVGHWSAQMVISCRSEYLPPDYKDRFQPTDRNHTGGSDLFQQAVIVPFSEAQINDYIEQYVSLKRPLWRTKSYLEALDKIPNLLDLVKNPFLLTLCLEVLPRVVDLGQMQDLSGARITRVALYDQFLEQWLERGKKRLGGMDLSPRAKAAFDTLVDEGFTQNGINFLKRLAAAIYKEQAGQPVVEYLRFRDEGTWKTAFLSREYEIQILREACPLIRSGNQYRFIHRSLLEYCLALAVFDPQESKAVRPTSAQLRRGSVSTVFSFDEQVVSEEESVRIQQPDIDHPLTWRNFVGEPSVLQFLAERVQQEPVFEQQLLTMIERSKTDKEGRKAAANAITTLVRAGIRFNGADLKGIRIPTADLSGGQFNSAQLQGADLRKANLRNIWLRQADLSNAQMARVQFGEWPYLVEDDTANSCAYSPDGMTLTVGLGNGTLNVYDTTTWEKIRTLSGHTDTARSVVYSPGGQQVASGSEDKTVRLWDAQTGAVDLILIGHTNWVTSVAYSPSGQQIASGSEDKTVRLWDALTGEPGLTLSGHTLGVFSVIYSPSGQQIASGSEDKTVRLWNAHTGSPGSILGGHTNAVTSVVYSPCGQQIASGSEDKTVRLWDAQSGAPGPTLSGHTQRVRSVVYSPNGQQIASSSRDKTVRFWDAQTGAPGPALSGHANCVTSAVYSPCGQQIASGSEDKTVRLWDAQSGAPGPTLSGHTQRVRSVTYSPNGRQLASGSEDKVVRLWDAQTGAPGPTLSGHIHRVMSVVYSPDGQQIASGSEDKTVQLWDAQSGAPNSILSGHTSTVFSVVYSPCGQQIASGSEDRTVRLWDAQTGAPGPILIGHTDSVTSVVYSPSGQQITSGSSDNTIRLWDAKTGAPGLILIGHTSWVTSVAYSPSGQRIASGSIDKTVRLWDTRTGEPGPILSSHALSVFSVAYSPSGQQIASGSADTTVRLWDANSGQCLAVVEDFHGSISSISWNTSDNGTFFATGCYDKSVRVWQVIEEGGHYRVQMQWSSTHGGLVVSGTNIQNVQGLSRINMQLLKQRGTVGKPVAPLSFRGTSEKLVKMASVVSQFKMSSNSTFPLFSVTIFANFYGNYIYLAMSYNEGGYNQGYRHGYNQSGYGQSQGYYQSSYVQEGHNQVYGQGEKPKDIDFDENMDVNALARHFAGETSHAEAFNNIQVPETNARDLHDFDPNDIERSHREFQAAGGESERGMFGFGDGSGKAKKSHQLIGKYPNLGGAAAWEAMKWYQNRQKKQGKKVHHSTLRKMFVAFATAKAVKWWEKSGGGQSGMSREAVVEQAARDAAALADTKFSEP